MKLLTPPRFTFDTVQVPYGDKRSLWKKLTTKYDPNRDALEILNVAGKYTVEKFYVRDDDNIQMYQKIEEITLEHNGKFYRIFGLLPLNKNPNGIQCICDYFDDGVNVKFTSQDGLATINIQ